MDEQAEGARKRSRWGHLHVGLGYAPRGRGSRTCLLDLLEGFGNSCGLFADEVGADESAVCQQTLGVELAR